MERSVCTEILDIKMFLIKESASYPVGTIPRLHSSRDQAPDDRAVALSKELVRSLCSIDFPIANYGDGYCLP